VKRITSHHDGHGRMERLIVLATDEPATEPPGNSSHHRYEFFYRPPANTDGTQPPDMPVGVLQFQRGPFDSPLSTPGTLGNAVLAALIDHLKGFLGGPLADRYTAMAVTDLEKASWALRARADERAARGVLGSMSK
jgi:hypothetical protein